ncbi:MAG: formamidopyrimidine-DNA glycosylase [Luteitalea sp.]|nr:formamidopyrimidine-DNA glycosylase [Luteitalea sp.]
MPELPDVVVYVEALERQLTGHRLERVRLLSPFVLRTVEPPIATLHGRGVIGAHRIGKRIALGFEGELFAVVHLMIAGRLRWRAPGQKPGMGPKMILAAFEFGHSTLFFTEAASRKRASIQLVQGREAITTIARGGIEPLGSTRDDFGQALTRERHTLKRWLTDPRLVSGIGNAYSDEILHAARLSPLKLTRALTEEEVGRLYEAMRATLASWTERLREEAKGEFPEKVTAFHPRMAVHGRYRQPCPVCGAPVQRIVYAANECNYCARCQTGGRLLADRSLSRLLKGDWPRSIDDL